MGRAASDDEVNTIRAMLLTRQYSAKQIAEVVGRSRGSVCGIIWRTPELHAIGLPSQNNPNRSKTERDRITQRLLERDGTMDAHDIEYGKKLLKGPLPLTLLASHHCRFPMWEHTAHPGHLGLFCAEKQTEGSSYCEHHRKICRSPVSGRTA